MHQTWSKYQSRNVDLSDEKNVEVYHWKKQVMLHRTPDKKYNSDCIVQKTKQGSGSIGIWACMNYEGVKFFKFFNGRLNK